MHAGSPGQLSFYRQAMGPGQRKDLPWVTESSLRPELKAHRLHRRRKPALTTPASSLCPELSGDGVGALGQPRSGPSPAWRVRIISEDVPRADVGASPLAYPCPPWGRLRDHQWHHGSSRLFPAPMRTGTFSSSTRLAGHAGGGHRGWRASVGTLR